LQHSFTKLASRHPNFPQPTIDELAQLASRAGTRFIVASTMVKFIIDDEDKDPRDRLQLMLKLTSELLPRTEAYKLYDCILSTCADSKRAYMHLSIVATLTDPLPISQFLALFGQGCAENADTVTVSHGYPYRQHSPREYLSLIHSRLRFRPVKLRPPSSMLQIYNIGWTAMTGMPGKRPRMGKIGCKLREDGTGCIPTVDESGCRPGEDKAGWRLREHETGCEPREDETGCRPREDDTGCRAGIE
jgi:hypothetical protein